MSCWWSVVERKRGPQFQMHLIRAFLLAAFTLLLTGCGEGAAPESFAVRLTGNTETVENKVYVFGGTTLTGPISKVGAYDARQLEWASLAPVLTKRASAASAVIGLDIYFVGGRNESSALDTCEKYQVKEDRWEICAPMLSPRWAHMAEAVNGKIYVFGGIDGIGDQRRTLDTIEVFDAATNEWRYLGNLPEARQGAAIAVVDTRLLIFSGKLAAYPQNAGDKQVVTRRVDSYDSGSGAWSRLADIPIGRVGAQAVVHAGLVYLVGGLSEEGNFPASIDVYDPMSNSWSTGLELPSGRSGHMVAQLGSRILVMGGLDVRYGNSSPKILQAIDDVQLEEKALLHELSGAANSRDDEFGIEEIAPYTIIKLALQINKVQVEGVNRKPLLVNHSLLSVLKDFDGQKISMETRDIDVSLLEDGIKAIIQNGAEVSFELSERVSAELLFTSGEIGIVTGKVFISEGTMAELDGIQYTFANGQWSLTQ